jgi:type III pantothenate kinase
MDLVIDVGNTHTKAAVFKEEEMITQLRLPVSSVAENLLHLFNQYPVKDAIISQAGSLPETVSELICRNCRTHFLSPRSKLPFLNKYTTPETLGADRLALSAAASHHFPSQNSLVIDAGTCITYDFLNAANQYLGGAISPGIRIRYQALHTFTAKLPLLETEDVEDFIGTSTKTSIHVGVLSGICHEIDGTILQYKNTYPTINIILTGGDAHFLAKRLKNTIFVRPNFLMEGLRVILQHNKT